MRFADQVSQCRLRQAGKACYPRPHTMSGGELQDVWRRRSDDQLVDAFRCIDEYGAESQSVIRAELVRRGLGEPSTTPIMFHDAEAVAPLQRHAHACGQPVDVARHAFVE
jgi:hypothetical protein